MTIAEYERRHEQLREANEKLVLSALGAQELLAAAEEARRQQSEMLALVANELSNPFAPIRLAASTLSLTGTEKTLLPRVQAIIEQQVDKMSRMVGELLDPPQTGPGQLAFEPLTFDASKPLDAAVEACRPEMDRRLQILEVTISRPLEVSGDPAFLSQVLLNLLHNASVYTPDGGWIRVRAELGDGNLILNVVDNGLGISPETLAKIFEPFVRDLRASAGLTAVRKIVEAHGGTAVAASAGSGHGSQFTVSLPTALASRAAVGHIPS